MSKIEFKIWMKLHRLFSTIYHDMSRYGHVLQLVKQAELILDEFKKLKLVQYKKQRWFFYVYVHLVHKKIVRWVNYYQVFKYMRCDRAVVFFFACIDRQMPI